MTCTTDARERAHDLGDELAHAEHVFCAEPLPPHVGPQHGWTVELTLTADARGLTPEVCHRVAAADARIPAEGAGRQGEYQQFVVTLA
jgi:hypothetical protein